MCTPRSAILPTMVLGMDILSEQSSLFLLQEKGRRIKQDERFLVVKLNAVDVRPERR